MAGPSAGVKVCVESVIENQVQEVTWDGEEIVVKPPTLSEKLTKLAHKIDFHKDESDGKGKGAAEGEKESDDEKGLAPFQSSQWPWDSVRTKLKSALTEVSVLMDVLNMARDRRYIIPDHVSQEQPESKAGVTLLSKKRNLVAAAAILMNGAERMKKSQTEATNRTQNDFYLELLALRQNWRLKKSGSNILGDLSYKSAGSRFWQPGTFEVVKSSEVKQEGEGALWRRSCLEVNVPSDLEGMAYILVEVKSVPGNLSSAILTKDTMDLTTATMKLPDCLIPTRPDAYWQQKLEDAQNVLFCKELFAQLAREAVQMKAATPHLVVGNQLITNIFPGVQLSIVLCHTTGKEKRPSQPPPKLEHNHVLEHSLHQLLREVHHRNMNYAPPHPVYAAMGHSKRRRVAGPNATSRRDIMQMMESKTLLEQIIAQTRHAVLRLRVMDVIDELAMKTPDPQITAHWSCQNSSLEASVRISITSNSYEAVRTIMMLIIGVDSIKAIFKDGRTCVLSFEEKELEDLILWQVSQHQLMVVQNLGKQQGWQILSASASMGTWLPQKVATACSIMMASPKGNRVLAFRSGPTSELSLLLQCLEPGQEAGVLPIGPDGQVSHYTGPFQDINIAQLEGKNLALKMDMLMAHLALA